MWDKSAARLHLSATVNVRSYVLRLRNAVARWHTDSSNPLAVAPGPDFRRRDLSQGGILKRGDLF